MEIRALTQPEQKYTYAQSMQLEGQTGCIGHLRGDFAASGYGFYTTWSDTREQWKTDEFQSELDDVINALREDKGLLHNRYDMTAFTKANPESSFLIWEIKQFFHKDNQTIVEWYFKNTVNEEKIEEFDGISLIVWNEHNKIISLKEFGCNINNYDPYQNGSVPQFQEETAMWF